MYCICVHKYLLYVYTYLVLYYDWESKFESLQEITATREKIESEQEIFAMVAEQGELQLKNSGYISSADETLWGSVYKSTYTHEV